MQGRGRRWGGGCGLLWMVGTDRQMPGARQSTLVLRLKGSYRKLSVGKEAGSIFSEYQPHSSVQNGLKNMNLVTD